MDRELKIVINPEDAGIRLDKLISMKTEGLTRSAAEKLIDGGYATCNGKALNKSYRGAEGDCIFLLLPEPEKTDVEPEAIPLDIVYEDSDLLVVNKPKGMVVHPAAGNRTGTLVNALLAYCGDSLSGINGVIRPGIVHRIDKDTSGLLIVAKNDFAHQKLAAQIKAHSFTRIYEAVVHGNVKEDDGMVDAPIGRHPVNRKMMAVTEKNSRSAVTHYHVLARYEGFTHIQCRLETGRTHQIRVHMAYIGHPVAGDPVYGPKKPVPNLNGQCLHARVIGFVHPRDGRYIEITSDLPAYFTGFLAKLRQK
ncbi:RluA family pseudouridine synthase [Caproiciproducens galactitolivorans]|uniref:Pseudouridine synthase n=1 Tax=Caproiciproducens galactitolivorans TaxID=642589 RepID=A0A4Z0YFR4_9FIRM|nr:RluA family pseudouridine synthase [Caproiciproducens galactitolivorans]QEY34175.1 RluA family pseudouridine synthase [Caproiciproducens galactitolivorans]TGJ78071.1 ribosomal large subunit pseudouridine synthase D [Caproiciproducens galactitolivorans]